MRWSHIGNSRRDNPYSCTDLESIFISHNYCTKRCAWAVLDQCVVNSIKRASRRPWSLKWCVEGMQTGATRRENHCTEWHDSESGDVSRISCRIKYVADHQAARIVFRWPWQGQVRILEGHPGVLAARRDRYIVGSTEQIYSIYADKL